MGLLSFGDLGYGDELLAGTAVTLWLALLSSALALAFGIAIGIFATGQNLLRRWLWKSYASIAMGVPTILYVFFIYYNAPVFLKKSFDLRVDVSPFMAGLAALTFVYSAYVAEVVRGAAINVPRGQWEAAQVLGLSRFTIWRLVILPQIWRLSVPGIVNVWMTVLKDTALVSLVGLTDLIRMAEVAAAVSKMPFLFFILAAMVFVMLSAATMFGTKHLEAWINRGYARAGDR